MNWHCIFAMFREKEFDITDDHTHKKFSYFPSSERHNDIGQLLKYLMEHDWQHVFKELSHLETK